MVIPLKVGVFPGASCSPFESNWWIVMIPRPRRAAVREILPYPSTLVGFPLPSFYPVLTTFKRNHDKLSYYFKLSAIPFRGRELVKLLSRHTVTRWVPVAGGSITLLAYRFPQVMAPVVATAFFHS